MQQQQLIITFTLLYAITLVSPNLADSEFFSFTLNDIRGQPVNFEQFRGKATLLVNTASQCTHTESQLKSLKRLHDILSHGNKFNVVAFPCNEFDEQEPWEGLEIEEYYRGHFRIEFPILEKGSVKEESSVLWKWVKENSVAPTDNFHKYLIDQNGLIVKNWPGEVSIESIFDEVQDAVEKIFSSLDNDIFDDELTLSTSDKKSSSSSSKEEL